LLKLRNFLKRMVMEELKILLVEDDEFAAELIYNYFLDYGFEVIYTLTAAEAIEKLEQISYDVVVLDLNLPDTSGFEVLKHMENKNSTTPVIVTSAYDDKNIKLRSFKYGASDYMIKPIDLEELEARIWVHLKRDNHGVMHSHMKEVPIFEIKDFMILFKGKKLDLTTIEHELLKYFIKNRNRIIRRSELSVVLSSVGTERSLDNHIKNIRKKLGENSKDAKYLKTVYGVGYFFNF